MDMTRQESQAGPWTTVASDAVRLVRRCVGLSVAELAERSGVSRAAIGGIENGTNQPTVRTLGRLVAGSGGRLRLAVEWSTASSIYSASPTMRSCAGGRPFNGAAAGSAHVGPSGSSATSKITRGPLPTRWPMPSGSRRAACAATVVPRSHRLGHRPQECRPPSQVHNGGRRPLKRQTVEQLAHVRVLMRQPPQVDRSDIAGAGLDATDVVTWTPARSANSRWDRPTSSPRAGRAYRGRSGNEPRRGAVLRARKRLISTMRYNYYGYDGANTWSS